MRKGIDHVGTTIVFMCHDGRGKYLLSKRTTACRDEHGAWEPGAGGLELHDTVIDTLHKEVQEEYGTDVLEYEFIGYRDMHRIHNNEKTHWIALDFKVLLDPATVQNTEPHKHDEIAWFSLDSFPAPLHSQFPPFLEQYKNIL